MLDSLKKWFGEPAPRSGWDALAPWAASKQVVFRGVRKSEGFVIDGRLGAMPWRLEWGPSQRSYVSGFELMSQILDALRPGDILTHCFSGAPNDTGQFTNIVQGGKLLPAAHAASGRGRRAADLRPWRQRRPGRARPGLPA